jgi:MFS transporter, SP family, solute carrier family 2 (myo-inositol transporter), member 13
VLGGSMVSSLAAGMVADHIGRKKTVLAGGGIFIASVIMIVLSGGFVSLMAGRLLQGASGGILAVVVPLYLAESLSAETRGKGTAFFQLMLTVGIVIAAVTGWFYTHRAEAAIRAAVGNPGLIRAAQEHAWRGMFVTIIYPGLAFFLGGFGLSETPRWLYRQGRTAEALASLRRSVPREQADAELVEMRQLAEDERERNARKHRDSIWQRRYMIPLLLACVVLVCNQATGVNSILSFLVLIIKHAGMSAESATDIDVAVKVLMCVMTAVSIGLVDTRGRRFLLKIGTAGACIALSMAGLLFFLIERQNIDVKGWVQTSIYNNSVVLPLNSILKMTASGLRSADLTVVYSYGDGERIRTIRSDAPDRVMIIAPENRSTHPLRIQKAYLSPHPTQKQGWLIGGMLCAFIGFYSLGPGVVVWLVLSELIPTRIRSSGMGIALLLNQGMATCAAVYFVTAALFLPETKCRTLEEIEQRFAKQPKMVSSHHG